MDNLSGVDLALLSFLGVNGRAFGQLSQARDSRDLIAASSLRAKKVLSDEELEEKSAKAETYRAEFLQFESQGGVIVGQGGAHELGNFMRAPTPPLCAYLRGEAHLLSASTKVAIIGTRAPSMRGVNRATELAGRLAQEGVLIVSGGAIGIDLAAHKGAMENGGETIAVLGDPVNPKRDERPQRLLALQPQKLLTTVTLFGPWVQPSKSLFVIRNQYVAALADAVVIIEGRPNSGTLHTARYANQMGVPVWVVPGDPGDEMSQAANCLLEQGSARALVRFEYFLSTLNPQQKRRKLAPPEQQTFVEKATLQTEKKLALSPTQEGLMVLLRQNGGRLTFDEFAEKSENSITALQQELLMLELLGAVKKKGMEFVVDSRS